MARRLPLSVLAIATVTVVLGLAAAPARAEAPTNDPEIGRQWGLADIKAPEAWAKGKGGGIRVAVVSSGIAPHPDLAGKVEGGADATGNDPANDAAGRGTPLAGIVGAATNNGLGIAGVARDAKVSPFKGFDTGSVIAANYVEAMRQVQKAKPQVALVDVPDGFPSDSFDVLRQSLKNLGDAGISVVVGATTGLQLGDLPVLAVAATSPSGGRAAGTVSDKGVGAPGQDVVATTVGRSLIPGAAPTFDYGTVSGTAPAAAHVAGAVAILRGLGAGPGQAADLLRSTARKNPDTALGAGVIDVAAAAGAYKAPPPTTATTGATATTTKATTTPGVGGNATGVAAIPKGLGGGATAGPTGPGLAGEPAEPGAGEAAVLPEGADELTGGGDSGGPSATTGGGDDRPLGTLAIGFGLLFGVGSGLSVTFRRLAEAATAG